ncbi:MAG: YceI family protein [Proteobacteria bacterium]|nr:YceI family protein [Pseudomonadota bacterium]
MAVAAPGGAHHLSGSNTEVELEVQHLGLRLFGADFHTLEGDFALAREDGGADLRVTVEVSSIDSHSGYWNRELRSAAWLDTERFPTMSFRSTAITREGTDRARVEGELTLHGVTRPLTLEISDIDCPAARSEAGGCRFRGRGQIRRSDFGLPHGFFQGGDTVQIRLRGH